MIHSITKYTLRQQIISFAKTLGFDLIGFTEAKINPQYLKAFKKWLKSGNEGGMKYMQKIAPRCDLQKIFPGAKSVIVLGVNYYRDQSPLAPGCSRIARYAYGKDYHKIIGKRLKELEKFISCPSYSFCHSRSLCHPRESFLSFPRKRESIQTKSYIDTGPVLERALAEQAGLGRIGKNTCLITKEFGSWVFLAEIITNIELSFPRSLSSPRKHGPDSDRGRESTPSSFPFCGRCTRCIDACPTGAIIAPGVIDARRCISYLTIENKNEIPKKFAKIIQKTHRLFGCDICQEVCPHNQARQNSINPAKNSIHKELAKKIVGGQLNLKKILSIKTDKQFLKKFAGSPLMRTKRKGLQRNAKILFCQKSPKRVYYI